MLRRIRVGTVRVPAHTPLVFGLAGEERLDIRTYLGGQSRPRSRTCRATTPLSRSRAFSR